MFAYLLKFISNHIIDAHNAFVVTCGHDTRWQQLESLTTYVPAKVDQRGALPSCFSPHSVNECSFCSLFSATFLHFNAFGGGGCFLSLPHKHSAEVLSRDPKCKRL